MPSKREDAKTNENQSNDQVIENPKEIRIVGNIARVYVQGNKLEQNIVFNPNDFPKKKRKSYIIIPVKDRNSQVEFVQVPIYKLSKQPDAAAKDSVNSKKLNRDEETTKEELTLWSTPKEELFDEGLNQETPTVNVKENTPTKDISVDKIENEQNVEKEEETDDDDLEEQSSIRESIQSAPQEAFIKPVDTRPSVSQPEEKNSKKKKDKKKEKKKDKKKKEKKEPLESLKESVREPSRILSYLVTVTDKKKK